MKNIILFDDDLRDYFLPMVYNKPIGMLRIGMWTIKDKWKRHSDGPVSFITQEYLSEKFSIYIDDDNTLVNARLLPNPRVVKLIEELDFNQALMHRGQLLAIRLGEHDFISLLEKDEVGDLNGFDALDAPLELLENLSDIFELAAGEIEKDFKILSEQGDSADLPSSVHCIGNPEKIFISEGCHILNATFNVSDGPIIIGKNATVMEGTHLRGPLCLGEKAVLKMGAKIYGGTSIGTGSKIGGEVSNSVIMDHSNKAHDGYLGNAVIGSWCNIGADSNCSNLKNNYGEIKQWNYAAEKDVNTGKQFIGLTMGDYSKCGINTMFNTATVVGISSNIFGGGFQEKFIPSFTFGGSQFGLEENNFEKAIIAINAMMARRDKKLSEGDIYILATIFELSKSFRKSGIA